ncbi:tripartite tricarboxylate transporter TctB family protein [Mobilicoccus massiliensis]|uniref:tripartite tricarboxylate transporter TctB family protein n=1 Tax=Mobilicoccus massiliensis TaxID=1522310 RepID=UPI00058E0974|nr:tripartite tricarboxylate transporter TctB family protein [Mobilicoccus massiliensis]
MSSAATPSPASSARPTRDGTDDRASFWSGRSGIVVPLLMAAFSTYLVVGILQTHVPDGADFPGPRFFPAILAVLGYVLAVLLLVQVIRRPEPVDHRVIGSDARHRTFSDWSAVAWCVGGFALFALTIELLGWILAAALLFWCSARGIGSRRPLFDVSLALVVSSVIYLAFAVGLGLNLPSGILGGI